MPPISALYRVRQGLCHGFAISATTVTGDDRNRGTSSEPGSGGCGLTVRQQRNDPAPSLVGNDRHSKAERALERDKMQVFITVGRAGCSLTLHNAISTGDPKGK